MLKPGSCRTMFLVLSSVLLPACLDPPPPASPTIKAFEVAPENTCAAKPDSISVSWATSGSSVDLEILDSRGERLQMLQSLPPDTSFKVATPPGLPAGQHTVKLTARNGSATTTESRPVELVGADGKWIGGTLPDPCDADSCASWGPVDASITTALVPASLTLDSVRVASLTPSFDRTKPTQIQVSHADYIVPICLRESECRGLPLTRGFPTEWGQPLGNYSFSGQLLPAQGKSENVSIAYGFHAVCR